MKSKTFCYLDNKVDTIRPYRKTPPSQGSVAVKQNDPHTFRDAEETERKNIDARCASAARRLPVKWYESAIQARPPRKTGSTGEYIATIQKRPQRIPEENQ